MSKNVKWAIILTIVVALCVGVILFARSDSDRVRAEISVDGNIIRTIDDLNSDKEQSFTVSTEHGENVVSYCDGEIWVSKADCANQTCVDFGKISSVGQSIICAPHKLVIRITGKSDKSADLTM